VITSESQAALLAQLNATGMIRAALPLGVRHDHDRLWHRLALGAAAGWARSVDARRLGGFDG
jgi:hypothetical protein